MLSLHVNSPVPNTLFAPKLNPSRSQTRITPPFSLRKVGARGSSAEVAVKENEQQRRRRSNERISDLSLEEEELPAGLNREAMPRHVAVIMDGNVRWARQRGLQVPGCLILVIASLQTLNDYDFISFRTTLD